MTNPRGISAIDARNGCYGNEEATADDGFSFSGADAIKASVESAGEGCVIKSGIDAHDAGQKRSAALNLAENRECTAIPPGGQSPVGSGASATTIVPEAPKYDGNCLPAMTAMVTGFVDKLAKFYSPCPQEATGDCRGDGKHSRLFACDDCSFVGCVSCIDLHESAGHESDSSTARERNTA